MRTTRGDVEEAFHSLATALGKDTTPWTSDKDGRAIAVVGAWYLDANPTYGGYIINEMMNESGGIRNPMTMMRMSGREFVQAVRFAMDAIRIVDNGLCRKAVGN